MSSETEWLDNLISSHKKKLEEIRQWQVVSSSKQTPQTDTSDQSLLELPQLSKKVTRKKAKIKTLKSTMKNLSEENTSLRNQLIQLENYTQSLTINHKKNQYDQTSQIEQEQSLLGEISRLQSIIHSLEGKIDKMTRIDNIKTQDIEQLNQRVKDLEIISEESASNANYELNKMANEAEVYRNQLNEVDKLFELFNYFVKRMSALFPKDISGEHIPYLNIKEYQNKLIQIENSIVNDKTKMAFELKGLDDNHYQKLLMLNKKIDQLTNENNALEEKINESQLVKVNGKKAKKEKENRSSSSDYLNKKNGTKAKKARRILSKAKTKK